MNILRTASLGSNYTGSYKKSVPQQEEGNHYSIIKGVLYRSGDATCFFHFQGVSLFVYQLTKQNFL